MGLTKNGVWTGIIAISLLQSIDFIMIMAKPWYSVPVANTGDDEGEVGEIEMQDESFMSRSGMMKFYAVMGVFGGFMCALLVFVLGVAGDKVLAICVGDWMAGAMVNQVGRGGGGPLQTRVAARSDGYGRV